MNLSRVYIDRYLAHGFRCLRRYGQETSNAVLVDSMARLRVDDTLGKNMMVFFSELRNESGRFRLGGNIRMPENKHRIVFRQTIIETQIKWRQFDPAANSFP
jgi:hypothetical protein